MLDKHLNLYEIVYVEDDQRYDLEGIDIFYGSHQHKLRNQVEYIENPEIPQYAFGWFKQNDTTVVEYFLYFIGGTFYFVDTISREQLCFDSTHNQNDFRQIFTWQTHKELLMILNKDRGYSLVNLKALHKNSSVIASSKSKGKPI